MHEAKYNLFFGKWSTTESAKDLTTSEILAKLAELMLGDTDWVSIVSHKGNSTIYLDLNNLKYADAEPLGAIFSSGDCKVLSEIRNPYNINFTYAEDDIEKPHNITKENKPMRRNVRNWKHKTKNRHPYMHDNRVYIPDIYGDWMHANRREAKLYGKRNTPFMQDEFNPEFAY